MRTIRLPFSTFKECVRAKYKSSINITTRIEEIPRSAKTNESKKHIYTGHKRNKVFLNLVHIAM